MFDTLSAFCIHYYHYYYYNYYLLHAPVVPGHTDYTLLIARKDDELTIQTDSAVLYDS